jgi:hypothetical protein
MSQRQRDCSDLILAVSLVSFNVFVWSNMISPAYCIVEHASHVVSLVAVMQNGTAD